MTPREAFDALLYELVPTRPTAPDALRMQYGPTEQWRLLQKQREAWAGPQDVSPHVSPACGALRLNDYDADATVGRDDDELEETG